MVERVSSITGEVGGGGFTGRIWASQTASEGNHATVIDRRYKGGRGFAGGVLGSCPEGMVEGFSRGICIFARRLVAVLRIDYPGRVGVTCGWFRRRDAGEPGPTIYCGLGLGGGIRPFWMLFCLGGWGWFPREGFDSELAAFGDDSFGSAVEGAFGAVKEGAVLCVFGRGFAHGRTSFFKDGISLVRWEASGFTGRVWASQTAQRVERGR